MAKKHKNYDGYKHKAKKRTNEENNGVNVGSSYQDYLKKDWSGNGERWLNRRPWLIGKAY